VKQFALSLVPTPYVPRVKESLVCVQTNLFQTSFGSFKDLDGLLCWLFTTS